MPIANEQLKTYAFLREMQNDAYFPPHLVAKGQQILIGLCEAIEDQRPADLDALYRLTHAATDRFNDLAEEFYEHDSEIETAARESIGGDFALIAQAYGFQADIEELIATRDW
ncbi:DUF5713 family protein [Pseudomonas sp. CGJS7]|uniref:DUF5713 family protein n=1 Tax=Pseudomonas sp. CGJS7 TaxID=3109348 RepID=UPI00300AB42E